MTTPVRLARLAGVLYLLMCVLGAFAQLVVRAGVRVPGDAVATAQRVAADPTSFRLALVADVAMATLFVLVGLTLHRLFRDVDRHAADALVVLVAVGAGMILTNLVLHQAALLVATDPSYGGAGSDELVLLLLDLHGHGYALAGIFFGLWLLPLGYLGLRSGRLPRPLAVLLVVAGCSWIVDTLVRFAFPELPAAVHAVLTAPTLAEFWLVAYLLVRGVRMPSRDRFGSVAVEA
jgi:hypothetical protein